MNRLYDWSIVVSEFGGKPKHWLNYYKFLYHNVKFANKTVLDIGGGVGRSSYYAAAAGAERVVLVEPEVAGSHNTMLNSAVQIGERLSLRDRVEILPMPLADVSEIGSFDIVLSHNSINHFDEAACSLIHTDEGAKQKYIGVARMIGDRTKPSGTLVLTDCSNRNFFALLKIKNPFAPTINWQIHQSPEIWSDILAHANFINPQIRWTPDRRTGWLGQILLANIYASFCLQSHFCLTMTKNH